MRPPLAVEAGELLEIFQWQTEEQAVGPRDPQLRVAAEEELADVLIYAIRLADVLEIRLPDAIDVKMQSNELRYPADKVRDRSDKTVPTER